MYFSFLGLLECSLLNSKVGFNETNQNVNFILFPFMGSFLVFVINISKRLVMSEV